MKMPDKIESAMFAPCGMNCLVCYKHCCHKKPCAGCLKGDHASLMENSRIVKEQGIAAFLVQQKEKFTCPECCGIISIHDAECSECQWKM